MRLRRMTDQFTTDGGSDAAIGASGTWADAMTAIGDTIIAGVSRQYDTNGKFLFLTSTQRLPSGGSRTSYSVTWYDIAGRPIASADAGANSSYSWPQNPPARGNGTSTAAGSTTTLIDSSRTEAAEQLLGSTITLAGQARTITAYDSGTHTITWSGALTSATTSNLAYTLTPAVLLTSNTYNAAGLVEFVTDPRGIKTKTEYDALGRASTVIEGYVDGKPSDDDDRTTLYTYDDGKTHQDTVTAKLPPLPAPAPQDYRFQTTAYVYDAGHTDGKGQGSQSQSAQSSKGVHSHDLLSMIKYPDHTSGRASELKVDQEKTTYDALGEVLTTTDRNGTVHTYTYDNVGRQIVDTVTTAGPGVDTTVMRIETQYDSLGRPTLISSFASAKPVSGEQPVNQIKRDYASFGQLADEWQEHSGAVNTAASPPTPKVSFTYDAAQAGRQTGMTYPNGRTITYNYDTGPDAELDSHIGRLSSISEGSTTLEGYRYLGLGTIVERTHPEPGVDLTYIKQSGESNGDGGDELTGLDRYGQAVDQRWLKTSTGAATDRFQYGHDRDGNVLYEKDVVNPTLSNLYHANSAATADDNDMFGMLGQLPGFQRGTLSASGHNGSAMDTVASPSQTIDYDLDALGNRTEDGQSYNEQNELTGDNEIEYDGNGSMIRDHGYHYTYDAWGKLTSILLGGKHVHSGLQLRWAGPADRGGARAGVPRFVLFPGRPGPGGAPRERAPWSTSTSGASRT